MDTYIHNNQIVLRCIDADSCYLYKDNFIISYPDIDILKQYLTTHQINPSSIHRIYSWEFDSHEYFVTCETDLVDCNYHIWSIYKNGLLTDIMPVMNYFELIRRYSIPELLINKLIADYSFTIL